MAVAVLPDGRIVSGSADTTLRIWNSDGGIIIRLWNRKMFEGHTGVSDIDAEPIYDCS
jgi:hypothetical protein